jgi:hypothetical protein
MKSFSLVESPLSWWVEICTSAPQQSYHLGPFNSQEEARISRGAHVESLYHTEMRDIVALIKQR